jgi:hypothetical protein
MNISGVIPRKLYISGKRPQYTLDRRLGDPRAAPNMVAKREVFATSGIKP